MPAPDKPYDNPIVDDDAPAWLRPRDTGGRFDVPRDPWGRPVEWVDADDAFD